jgi:hypothetical protein
LQLFNLGQRVEHRPNAAFWPVALRKRLPVIPVPVRAPDSDARIDLQAVLDRIYDDAGYADYIYAEIPTRVSVATTRLGLANSSWLERSPKCPCTILGG